MLREFAVPAGHGPPAAPVVTPAPARPAATVVLVRDGEDGVEVFLLRRPLSMAFAAGMHVFPGGGVDPRDASGELAWAGPDAESWAEAFGTSADEARALVCAAVRETFEECGVLLAGRGDSPAGGLPDTDDDWEADRASLVARSTALSDVLHRRGLVLRSDLLRAWAHWTTPLHEPRRFSTRFLLAVLPAGQSARHVAGESDESGWWPAAEVLRGHAAGIVSLMPPTLLTLEELAAAPSAEALWTTRRTVREVMPMLRRKGPDVVLVADLPEQR